MGGEPQAQECANIGQRIKNARIAKGLTQEELGELLGVQKSAIAKYENGRVVNIKNSTLKKISAVLGVSPSELILNTEEEYDNELQCIMQALVRIKKNDPNGYSGLVGIIKSLDK